jgi:hypothetical protein
MLHQGEVRDVSGCLFVSEVREACARLSRPAAVQPSTYYPSWGAGGLQLVRGRGVEGDLRARSWWRSKSRQLLRSKSRQLLPPCGLAE